MKALDDRPFPRSPRRPTDAIVRVVKTASCGTDLHILKGYAVSTATTGTAAVLFNARSKRSHSDRERPLRTSSAGSGDVDQCLKWGKLSGCRGPG
jgi:hypothetical protein